MAEVEQSSRAIERTKLKARIDEAMGDINRLWSVWNETSEQVRNEIADSREYRRRIEAIAAKADEMLGFVHTTWSREAGTPANDLFLAQHNEMGDADL